MVPESMEFFHVTKLELLPRVKWRLTHYLIFKVEIDTRAKIIVIIQNRTIILGSATPFNSK